VKRGQQCIGSSFYVEFSVEAADGADTKVLREMSYVASKSLGKFGSSLLLPGVMPDTCRFA
jgi:hypothetical protein